MKNSTELKQERASKMQAQQDLVDAATADNKRSFTEEENTRFDAIQTEIEALDKDITRAEKFEANQARLAGTSGVVVGKSEEREHAKMIKRYDFHKAIRSQMPNGILDGVEKEIHEETLARAEKAGVAISGLAVPTDFPQKRASGATVTEDSGAYGGNLVDTDLQAPIDFLRPKPIVESLGARFMPGLKGNLKFPTNGGGIAGAWEGEVDAAANTKNAYGSKTMQPNRYAVAALVSLQNLMQSSIDLQAYTISDIRKVIANAIDLAAINGSGSNDIPEGILNTSGIGSVVGGTNGAVPTWDHIVGLETAITSENADVATMAYLINPGIKGKLKTTKHSAGDLGYLMGSNNEINGYQVGVSTHVPSDLTKGDSSGVANAAIFGDFSQLLIGQWAFLDLTVDNISQKKDGYVEIVVNTFIDILVKQPKSFAAVKDWLLTA